MESTIIMIAHLMGLLLQFGVSLDPRNLWTLSALIALLLKGTRLHLYELARALPGKGTEESRAQKLRRWLSNPHITPALFVPLWIRLVAPFVAQTGKVTLIFDRTDWKKRGVHLNILLCSIGFFGRSFPVNWTLLPKGGCSCLKEQQDVLRPVLEAVQAHPQLAELPRTAIADREFGSPLLAEWLRHEWSCHYGLRVKQSVIIRRPDIPPIPVRKIFAHCEQGQYYFFKDVEITDTHRWRANLFVYWRADCDEPIALMTDLAEADLTHTTYRERTFIETLHRDFKSGGYDIEGSRVTDLKRVTNLLIPAAFAYTMTLIQGRLEELRDPLPPLQPRRLSLFSKGRNRFTDLLERRPFPVLHRFLRQLVQFLGTLIQRHPTEDLLQTFTLFAQKQLLLL